LQRADGSRENSERKENLQSRRKLYHQRRNNYFFVDFHK
jgi:prepilin-type processing-associated H-X9-DG protein